VSTTTTTPPAGAAPAHRKVDRGQYALAALLVAIGGYTVYDATTLNVGFGDPVGPRAFPYVVGSVLLVLGALLVIATARGDQPAAEEGEDIDLTHPADWATVGKLVAVLFFTIATIGVLGWAINGAILFAGSAWALGSRTLVRDVLIGIVMSVGSWYGFYVGLDIPLSAGILDGIL
jgi:putative tricarboxylic transport membrane protein